MSNLSLFFLSWGLALGVSLAFSISIIYKKMIQAKEYSSKVDLIEKEFIGLIVSISTDELKQTPSGSELLELVNVKELTTGTNDLYQTSSSTINKPLIGRTTHGGRHKGLGERHLKILDFISEYQYENQRPPSIQEISAGAGISSLSTVDYYLDQLEKMGKIERDRNISRGIRISGVNSIADTIRVPILGPIAAGIPLPELRPGVSLATGNEAHAIDIARSLLPPKEKGENLFALEVKGESMIDAMINDGDIIIMRPSTYARNGEMVAVWLPRDNEATLKYYFKEKDRYRLQPANPTMKPIFVKYSDPLEIKGKVIMVIRKMDKPSA